MDSAWCDLAETFTAAPNQASIFLYVLVLTIIQGPSKGKSFQLPAHEPQLIGRSSEALPIDDTAISRRHAELTPDEGTWYIRDLESQNGTYVNGTRIVDRTRLRSGDQIRTGQTVFVFGQSGTNSPELVRIVGRSKLDASIERTLPSASLDRAFARGGNDDSMILAEPEPRIAAIDHLRVIYELSAMLSERVLARAELLEGVMDLVFREMRPQRGCIVLAESAASGGEQQPLQPMGEVTTLEQGGQSERFLPVVVRHKEMPLDPEEAKIRVSKTILQHVLRKSEGVLSSNAMTDPRFAKGDSVQRMNIRSAICVPIRFRSRTFGAIYVDSSISNYTFTAEQLALLIAIGQHAGMALSNAQLYSDNLQAERLAAMGQTVASLSHSIKNILQGLRGGADVVELGLAKGDVKVARGGWPILQRNLSRIMSLTMNMLAFSRPRQLEVELASIPSLLQDCAQLIESQAHSKQVALLVDVETDVPPVPLDTALVHQAVMNLLTNAVDAAPPNTGAVTARAMFHPAQDGTRPSPAHVEIAIIDNGPGIPQSKQRWIQEPFNTTKGTKGTGLGLAVARRVAQQHGGQLIIESTPGKGAIFRLLFPTQGNTLIDPSATSSPR